MTNFEMNYFPFSFCVVQDLLKYIKEVSGVVINFFSKIIEFLFELGCRLLD